ncbi:hypothetical protein MRX96_027450 [Rhipicephalus microplus]
MRYPLRKDCLVLFRAQYAVIQSTDLDKRHLECPKLTILFEAPADTTPTVQFQEVRLSGSAAAQVEVLVEAEAAKGLVLGNSSVLRASGRDRWLALRARSCRSCYYRTVVYALDSREGCNATLTRTRGEWHSPPPSGFLPSGLALFHHHIGTHRAPHTAPHPIPRAATRKGPPLDPLLEAEGWTVKYEFVKLCRNETHVEANGRICYPPGKSTSLLYSAPGDCHFALVMPLGYEVQLSFSTLQVSASRASSSCPDSFLEVSSGGVEHRFCGNWTGSPELAALRLWRRTVSSAGYPGGLYCYRVFNESLSWAKANDVCGLNGGHLASVTGEDIQSLLDTMLLGRSELGDDIQPDVCRQRTHNKLYVQEAALEGKITTNSNIYNETRVSRTRARLFSGRTFYKGSKPRCLHRLLQLSSGHRFF